MKNKININNTSGKTPNNPTGSPGPIDISGSIGTQGTTGPMINDKLNEIKNKYKRFIINTTYDDSFMPNYKITDTINNKEYNTKPKVFAREGLIKTNTKELETFLIEIIEKTRQEIINEIING
jgi:hypothetical protein